MKRIVWWFKTSEDIPEVVMAGSFVIMVTGFIVIILATIIGSIVGYFS